MYRFISLLLFICFTASGQKFQSPQEYFGYGFGERFHFHAQVAEYARYITQANPGNTRLLPYGKTFEGRDLLVVALGSEENINRLEEIRKSNLRQIGLEEGTPETPVPVIAMLSYNIHGNEAVNTEVALQMLYELAKPGAEFAEKIFKNTVVLIDPCANPDGYDRYTQWYNRHIGQQPDADPEAIEHREPWPGGRFNHYHFDMNRDLAWQTQSESRQRVSFYNSWMPHFHGDFHEMGPGSSYFFAPSAKPFHEDFTVFQREFQDLIGEYHKREFDEKGWLYYTKQNFDLLYPSYGDTYPSYNGAIGMTYEQGGSGVAGLAYARATGDTLTLKERMLHSRSTGMAALEALTVHAPAVKEAFVNYFTGPAQKGHGQYKSFVMKGRESDIRALTSLLDRLDIRYSFAESARNLSGFRYKTQKKDNFTLEAQDLIVNTYQPKGILTKILFEPHTMLEDSNTYDITAWALPYAYGLEAYGVEQKLEGGNRAEHVTAPAAIAPVYAYALTLDSFESYRFLAAALKNGVKARVQPEAFRANKKSFPAGTVVFLREGDKAFGEKINRTLAAVTVHLEPLYTGMVEKGMDLGLDGVRSVQAPKVGILMGAGLSPTGFGDVWHFFDQQLGYPATLLDNKSFGSVRLERYDVLVFPGGRYDKAVTESQALKDWVNRGGRMILMEDACAAFAGVEGYELKVKTQKEEKKAVDLSRKYAEASRKAISNQVAGAIYEVKLDHTHPLAYGYGESMYLLIKESNDFENLKEGWNVGVLGEYKSGFVGNNVKEGLKDATVFGVQHKGRGRVIYLTESPIFRGFWHTGKALFANAVFFVK